MGVTKTMDGYCAACGAKAPSRDIAKDAANLALKGWRMRQSIPLSGGKQQHWILLCPECLETPSPAAERILELWKSRKNRP
jgi:hypothetical protein